VARGGAGSDRSRRHACRVPPAPRILVTCVLAALAAALALAAGDQGFWLCLPFALLAATLQPRGSWALAAAGGVMVCAACASPPALVAVVAAPASAGILIVLRSRLERERDAMRRFALRDPLTGLGNRRMLDERLRYEVTRHRRHGQEFTVLVFDLDGFKAVNDRFGHDAGDEVLREVASALIDVVRAQDTVVRLGGDEFCVLAPQTDSLGAEHLEQRVHRALGRISSGVAGVRASVGAAIFPADGQEPDRLLAVADAASLERKRASRAGRPRSRAHAA
jgi:diguanylate cyclase (GGDEF)-like protein